MLNNGIKHVMSSPYHSITRQFLTGQALYVFVQYSKQYLLHSHSNNPTINTTIQTSIQLIHFSNEFDPIVLDLCFQIHAWLLVVELSNCTTASDWVKMISCYPLSSPFSNVGKVSSALYSKLCVLPCGRFVCINSVSLSTYKH